MLNSGKIELMAAVLFGVALLLRHSDEKYGVGSSNPDNSGRSSSNSSTVTDTAGLSRVAQMKSRIWIAVGENKGNVVTLTYLLKTAQQPTSSLRYAAADVLAAAASQQFSSWVSC
jgi:hypothetical protein